MKTTVKKKAKKNERRKKSEYIEAASENGNLRVYYARRGEKERAVLERQKEREIRKTFPFHYIAFATTQRAARSPSDFVTHFFSSLTLSLSLSLSARAHQLYYFGMRLLPSSRFRITNTLWHESYFRTAY